MEIEATLTPDVAATLTPPLAVVFDHLAAPERLGDWLVEIVDVTVDGTGCPDVGAEFALSLRAEGDATVAATGDVVAYEPPWQVAYRLCVGPRQHLVRITCTAHDGGTRVRVAQGGSGRPLAVAVAGLAPARRAGTGHPDPARNVGAVALVADFFTGLVPGATVTR